MVSKPLEINKYVKVKKEGVNTYVYINGKKIVPFNYHSIPREYVRDLEEINTLDEFKQIEKRRIELTNKRYSQLKNPIPEDVKLLCSLLEEWSKNKYRNEFLYSDLALTLLKELTIAGDPEAKRVFEEEIKIRFSEFLSGTEIIEGFRADENELNSLLGWQYLDYLNPEELNTLFQKYENFTFEGKTYQVINGYLLMGHKNINSLPDDIFNLQTLVKLDLSYNDSITLPERISELKMLRGLNLGHSKLKILPDSMGDLKSLILLNLEENSLTSLPESIGQMDSLTYLNVYGNMIEKLPDSLLNLKSLHSLDLSHNDYHNPIIPDWIGKITSLRTLNLECINLFVHSELPFLKNLNGIETLSLRSNELETLPDYLDNLKSLKVLDLGENPLTFLPETMGNLHSLEVLYLDETELESIPEPIESLYDRSLKVINVNGSPLYSQVESKFMKRIIDVISSAEEGLSLMNIIERLKIEEMNDVRLVDLAIKVAYEGGKIFYTIDNHTKMWRERASKNN